MELRSGGRLVDTRGMSGAVPNQPPDPPNEGLGPEPDDEVEDEDEDEDEDHDWITDELDLHTFRPSDVVDLVPDYIDEAVKRGYESVRIIHGKGKGTLRRIVHAALERHPAVEHFQIVAFQETGGKVFTQLSYRTPI